MTREEWEQILGELTDLRTQDQEQWAADSAYQQERWAQEQAAQQEHWQNQYQAMADQAAAQEAKWQDQYNILNTEMEKRAAEMEKQRQAMKHKMDFGDQIKQKKPVTGVKISGLSYKKRGQNPGEAFRRSRTGRNQGNALRIRSLNI